MKEQQGANTAGHLLQCRQGKDAHLAKSRRQVGGGGCHEVQVEEEDAMKYTNNMVIDHVDTYRVLITH